MARVYGYDIVDAIKDKLDSDLNNMITTINTERTLNTPGIKTTSILIGQAKNQYPEVYIDLLASEIIDNSLTPDVNNNRENFTVQISIALKYLDDKAIQYLENYIEAIIRVLDSANLSSSRTGISYIFAKRTARTDVYTKEGNTLKYGLVEFEIRVN